jgi:hypothetical protein
MTASGSKPGIGRQTEVDGAKDSAGVQKRPLVPIVAVGVVTKSPEVGVVFGTVADDVVDVELLFVTVPGVAVVLDTVVDEDVVVVELVFVTVPGVAVVLDTVVDEDVVVVELVFVTVPGVVVVLDSVELEIVVVDVVVVVVELSFKMAK